MAQASHAELLSHINQLAPVQMVLSRLKTELSPALKYHSAAHTSDVLSEVLLFALTDSLSYQQMYLLGLAAAFHDVGFILQPKNNEALCAQMTVDALREEPSLTPSDLKQIEEMILDTALQITPNGPKQIPRSPLAGYLLDADVSNLGREDFLEKAELIREEVGAADTLGFYKNVLVLLDAHEWYSPAARALRQEQKERNRAKLVEMIENGFK